MKHTIEVVSIDDDRISILGKEYYTKEYLEEMMRREYQRGLHRGQIRYVPKEDVVDNNYCACKKPWGVSGYCVICDKKIKIY